MEYKVEITTVEKITVKVEAGNMALAKEIAVANWENNEYADADTHVRPKCESVKFGVLYPDLALMR